MPHDPSSEVGMYLFFCAEVRKGRRERGEGRLEGRRCEERKRERGRISGDVEERGGQKRGGGEEEVTYITRRSAKTEERVPA